MQKVDRRCKCKWSQGDEVIWLRHGERACPEAIDAVFEVRGPLARCYVWRAWNFQNGGVPEDWEAWPNMALTSFPLPPKTLLMADEVAWRRANEKPDRAAEVAHAMARLRASAGAMMSVRLRTRAVLEELNAGLTKQWYRVNSTNTVAAGLAVASLATMVPMPPVGVALGLGSAAAGVGATTGDVVADRFRGSKIARTVQEDLYEQLGFEAVESELQMALQSAAASLPGNGGTRGGRALARGAAFGTQTVTVAVEVLRQGGRAGRLVGLSQVGTLTGKVLGGVGAGLAVGVAVHGWSTLKPNQKVVQEKIKEVERSIDYLSTLLDRVSGALQCPICDELLHQSEDHRPIWRCRQFHCFHEHCMPLGDDKGRVCPLCPREQQEELSSVTNSRDQLVALLWRWGIRDYALGLESLAPQVLAQGRSLVQSLAARARELQPSHGDRESLASRLVHDMAMAKDSLLSGRELSELPEDADTHAAWQDALEDVESLDAVDPQVFEELIICVAGIPIKYRHKLWPRWLRVKDRRSQAAQQGLCYETLALATLSEEVLAVVEADIPRTREGLLIAGQHDSLRRLLIALAAYNPVIGYAQGMNQIAAVFLKLGFEEDDSFWMLVAVLEDFLPGCHATDLHGLFRDTAVAEVLMQTLLPRHAAVIEATGVQLLWLAIDFFLTLSVKGVPLAHALRFWDLCFLYGPRAIFCGFLAYLEVCFPTTHHREADAEEMLCEYRTALHGGDSQTLIVSMSEFLHRRNGGVSEQLVEGLRATLGNERARSSCPSSPDDTP